ncbi:hypothetical protein ACI2K4_02435 [Micromonospora sp. NPDC050397]|uniref:hypothetical protein n=1 Tax=Micromonospora sp. NPDC050397 TaxID=3364279 RepID=UPI00384C2438
MTEHDEQDADAPQGVPHRPGAEWHCTDDGEEWPCQIFKRRMWTWYQTDRRRLAWVMAGFRDKALASMPELTREQAETRFLGWVDDRPVRRRPRSI